MNLDGTDVWPCIVTLIIEKHTLSKETQKRNLRVLII